jgi:hypothetical protein
VLGERVVMEFRHVSNRLEASTVENMIPIHPEALKRAREMVNRDFGSIADLEEELRNTIANTYYRLGHLDLEAEREFGFPLMISLESGLGKGLEKFAEESALLTAGAKFLPEIIKTIRDLRKNGDLAEYQKGRQTVLDMFKYRIPDLPKKSAFRLTVERPFYAARVEEIPNLWRLF